MNQLTRAATRMANNKPHLLGDAIAGLVAGAVGMTAIIFALLEVM